MSDWWVAFTPREGPWLFTASSSPEVAISKFVEAIRDRAVLSIPIDNPITAIRSPSLTAKRDDLQNERRKA